MGFDQSERTQGPIYILKLDRNMVHVFYFLNNDVRRDRAKVDVFAAELSPSLWKKPVPGCRNSG